MLLYFNNNSTSIKLKPIILLNIIFSIRLNIQPAKQAIQIYGFNLPVTFNQK